jgi:hypothetical protein
MIAYSECEVGQEECRLEASQILMKGQWHAWIIDKEESGAWSLEPGAWSLEPGAWSPLHIQG